MKELVNLAVSHLEVGTSRQGEVRGIRCFQEFPTVRLRLHLQRDFTARIAPDLLIDHPGWLLCREYQVDAETSADARGRDELRHKLRLLGLQFRKLIGNQKEVRERFFGESAPIRTAVGVDVVHARRAKQPLPPRKLALYGEQGAATVTAVQIGDGAEELRQIRKEMGHAAALIINQQKADFLRRKL